MFGRGAGLEVRHRPGGEVREHRLRFCTWWSKKIEDRHSEGHPVGYLAQDDGAFVVDDVIRELDPSIDGPGVHDEEVGVASQVVTGNAKLHMVLSGAGE